MKLKPGTRLSIEIIQIGPTKFRMLPKLLVGRTASKDLGEPTKVDTEEGLWMALEDFAQERLAKLGLDKVK